MLSYQEYKKLKEATNVALGIDPINAWGLIKYLPQRYQLATYFWGLLGLLLIPAGILVAVFYKWWVGLIMLFFLSPVVIKATRKSAAEFVLGYAEENEKFFNALAEEDILLIK